MSDAINKVVDERDFGHARIPNELTRQYARKITKNGIAIYCALAAHSDANHSCFPSLETIAEESDTCKQTVVTYLKLLQKMRMIHIIHHRMDNSKEPDVNSYVFRDKSEWHPPDVDLSLLDEFGEIKEEKVVQGIDHHANKQQRSLRRRQQVVQEIDNRSPRRRQQVVQGVDSKKTHSEEHPTEEPTIEEYPSSLSNTLARADEAKLAPLLESEWELPPHPLQVDHATQPTMPAIFSESAPVAIKQRKPRTPKAPMALLVEDSPAMKLAMWLRKKILERKPDSAGLPPDNWQDKKMQEWARQMDVMLRDDNRDHIVAAKLIEAAQRDPMRNDFSWGPIIKNPAKLREHYDTLQSRLLDKNSPVMSNIRQGGNHYVGPKRIPQAPRGPNAYQNDGLGNDTIPSCGDDDDEL